MYIREERKFCTSVWLVTWLSLNEFFRGADGNEKMNFPGQRTTWSASLYVSMNECFFICTAILSVCLIG